FRCSVDILSLKKDPGKSRLPSRDVECGNGPCAAARLRTELEHHAPCVRSATLGCTVEGAGRVEGQGIIRKRAVLLPRKHVHDVLNPASIADARNKLKNGPAA